MKQELYTSWHDTKIRWLLLALLCLFQAGCSLCIDFPFVLATEIQNYYNVHQQDINYLYAIYSMPNIILPFFGGIIIDKIGIRSALLIFCAFLIIGQSSCVYSAQVKDFNLLKVGMFLLGLGAEVSLLVTQGALLTKWFFGKEISLAFGIQLTFIRVGSIIAVNQLPQIYVNYGNSFVACMTYCLATILIITLSCIIETVIDYVSDRRDSNHYQSQAQLQLEQQKPVSCKDLKEFNYGFYLISISCMCGYCIFFILQLNALRMFQIRYNLTFFYQTLLYSLPYIICIILTPIIGHIVDKVGKRPYFLILSGFLTTLSMLVYSLNNDCSVQNECFNYALIGQILNGMFFSLFAPLIWPCIPICVSTNTQGTGFGVVCSMQNFGLTVFPIIVGKILIEETAIGYLHMIYFLGFIALIANISNINIYFYDRYNGNKLMSPTVKLPDYQIILEQEDEQN
ncbi:unnamed protein product (macronuclear) [Paramecium tetraurelia]|uniref:Lysosomal dipeptide transporter MFSD1 n=1 Tax=Paramecium tetraurelia TaxID=5888 RepID=A0CYR3_PARTE|nr:uncharacterized protein GSPATT00011531001 [Paramecium tetraurelia]CAK75930.1 unnamed protein product [Paramecium tetraurelia]|eukprot:XP_001443327.1 hypothetical protein (macronuclear) [Paramecium tetraurelia strain d4-2]